MKDSQVNPYEHSEIKVKLLKLYLEKYISVLALAKRVKEIMVYDLFCGEGKYDNGKEGSPIIILKLLKDIYFRNKQRGTFDVKFNCFFNDFDAKKIGKVKAHIEEKKLHYTEMGSLTFLNEDYQELKSKIITQEKKRGRKTFVFIDPYGYKDISVNDIERFLSDRHTEVLLFLPTQFMYRFEKDATPDSLHEFLIEALLEHDLGTSDSGVDFINKLRDGFGAKLKDKHYVDSFIITREANQYFALFFFTSHLYGFEKFLEAKWNIDEEEGRGWAPKKQDDLFSTLEAAPNTSKFEENLKQFLAQKRSNIELHKFTIENRHLTKHANEILKGLENSNNLEVSLIDGSKPRKHSYYIGWNEVKTRKEKCHIKTK